MRLAFAVFPALVSCSISQSTDPIPTTRTSLIPSTPLIPTATPTPTSAFRADPRKCTKNIHDFFKEYGWLQKNETIPEAGISAAVRKIQKALKRPETGIYDHQLHNLMSRPRCGTEQVYNAAEAGVSLNKARFVLWGPKWDHSPITYRILNFTADISADQQRSIISNAFAKWTALLPLSIIPAPSNAPRADIHILFQSMGAAETRYAFTNMIADSLALSSGLINITFNDDYNWSDDRLFNFTATHEIGHALGLSHSKVEDAIMFAYYDAKIADLHPDDKAAIHSVYGWRVPRWSKIDGNKATKNLIQVSSASTTPALVDGIYQLRSTGQVLYYTPSGSWTTVDNNKETVQITGSNGYLYQRHADGSTYKYSGRGSDWQWIGNASPSVIDIVAASDQIYNRRNDGYIARWSGTAQTWNTIQPPSSPISRQIAISDSKVLWALLENGDLIRSEWPYTSTGWQKVDINPDNIAIAVGGEEFYKLQSDGSIVWLNTAGFYWSVIEDSGSVEVYAVGGFAYSRHGDGSLWRYTGTPGVWEGLDESGGCVSVIGDRKGDVFKMVKGGSVMKLIS